MRKLESIVLMATAVVTMGSCGGGKNSQPAEVANDPDLTAVMSINRDSMMYGICGEGSAMNTLQLITDIGDTLTLSIAEANEKGKCFGGFQSGDRIAVVLSGTDETTASMVINQSALLGDWVMPNPIDGSSEMGIRIKEGGVAESIDQPSMIYRSWRLFNGKLELVAIREGGIEEEEINLYDIVSLGADSLVFKDSEDVYEYSRYQERGSKVDIILEEASEDDYRI